MSFIAKNTLPIAEFDKFGGTVSLAVSFLAPFFSLLAAPES